jgi:hypothetical protein
MDVVEADFEEMSATHLAVCQFVGLSLTWSEWSLFYLLGWI